MGVNPIAAGVAGAGKWAAGKLKNHQSSMNDVHSTALTVAGNLEHQRVEGEQAHAWLDAVHAKAGSLTPINLAVGSHRANFSKPQPGERLAGVQEDQAIKDFQEQNAAKAAGAPSVARDSHGSRTGDAAHYERAKSSSPLAIETIGKPQLALPAGHLALPAGVNNATPVRRVNGAIPLGESPKPQGPFAAGTSKGRMKGKKLRTPYKEKL